jgi:hypothetical protein
VERVFLDRRHFLNRHGTIRPSCSRPAARRLDSRVSRPCVPSPVGSRLIGTIRR